MRQEFGGLAGTRQRIHSELVDFDSIHAEFAGDRVAQTAFEVTPYTNNGASNVLLQDYMVGLGGGDVTPQVLDGIIDDLNARAQADEPIFKEVPL